MFCVEEIQTRVLVIFKERSEQNYPNSFITRFYSCQNPLFCILNKNYLELQAHILNSAAQFVKTHSVLIVFKTNVNCNFLYAPKIYTGQIPWDLLGLNSLKPNTWSPTKVLFYYFFYFPPAFRVNYR